MTQPLEVFSWDAWQTQEEKDLYDRFRESGEVVAADIYDGGYGHHNGSAVVLYQGSYYVVSGGGCSCEGSASVDGPFPCFDDCNSGLTLGTVTVSG